MQIAILNAPDSFSDYIQEILQTWGVRRVSMIAPGDIDESFDVVICPADLPTSAQTQVLTYVRRGGSALAIEPTGALAEAAGLTVGERRIQPLRLRIAGFVASGIAGETLPVAGGAQWYEGVAFDDDHCLAGLYDPARIDGIHGECAGIVETKCGDGRLITIGFDLPRSVMLLRQGDPANAEKRLHDETKHARTPKASDLATDIGPRDCGWLPYADMQSRLLVDLVERLAPSPVVLVGHLPDEHASITLFSGDEDAAELEATKTEFDWLTEHAARMTMYIIPEETHSTAEHGKQYRQHHDIAPHPNLLSLREAPAVDRVAEYERQIKAFNEKFGMQARTVSNHVATWAGYLDLVKVQARCGIRMDLNYFSGHYNRERNHTPYSPFGAAMPMRFCEPDGNLIDVYQQHRHIHDDIMFLPGQRYSYGYKPAAFERYVRRMFDDSCQRFHTPIVANLHPSNWVKFSAPFGKIIVAQSQVRNLPVWSFEQWLDFREAMEGCAITDSSWDGKRLALTVSVATDRDDMRLWLPATFASKRITGVTIDGADVAPTVTMRYERPTVIVPARTGRYAITYELEQPNIAGK